MIFQITYRCIALGIPFAGCNCPAAHAILDKLPETKVSVDLDRIKIDNWSYETPQHLAQWIHNFDANRDVEPIDFSLEYRP